MAAAAVGTLELLLTPGEPSGSECLPPSYGNSLTIDVLPSPGRPGKLTGNPAFFYFTVLKRDGPELRSPSVRASRHGALTWRRTGSDIPSPSGSPDLPFYAACRALAGPPVTLTLRWGARRDAADFTDVMRCPEELAREAASCAFCLPLTMFFFEDLAILIITILLIY
jgi:hypothetical protein